MKTDPKALSKCLALLLVLAGCAPPEPKPNVLLITLDTTRADRLGCYGYDKDTTPRLDALAARGLLFESAISQAAVTPVSHASILTGLNPYSHGLRVLHGAYENRLADRHVTLAEILREEGWETAAFVSAFPVTEAFGLHQGYDTFDADFLVEGTDALRGERGEVNTGQNQRRGDETTDLALEWLEAREAPFHLWLHYFDPHDDKVIPPDEVMAKYGGLPRETRARLLRLYDIEVEFMDAQVGRVLEALDRRGELENTLIVVVSDHGEGLGDHDWWTHGVLYQEQVRVPLILAGPGIPAGRRSDALVSTTDIVPTLLALCGIEGARTDGEDLLVAANGRRDSRSTAYADSVNILTYNFAPGISDKKDDMLFCVVQGRWKYIHHLARPQESELYDLETDPKELRNLAADRPEVVARLRELAVGGGHVPETQLDHNGMSTEDIERLRSLGYVSDE